MIRHLSRAVRAAALVVAALFVSAPAFAEAGPSPDAIIKALTQKLLETTDAEMRWRAQAIDQAALIQRLQTPDDAVKAKSVPTEPPAPLK